jgi:hypothetical protein
MSFPDMVSKGKGSRMSRLRGHVRCGADGWMRLGQPGPYAMQGQRSARYAKWPARLMRNWFSLPSARAGEICRRRALWT